MFHFLFQNDNVTLTVNILDENDNAPIFNKTRYDFNVTEEKPSGTYVGSVAVGGFRIFHCSSFKA